jgi:glutamate dehydrogenase (NAD(P)+)
MDQSFHAAISRSPDPEATLRRVRDGLNAVVDGGYLLGDVIGGYGVAQACLGVADARLWEHAATTVAVQGIGTMGGSAAWYLHEAGMRVVAIADAVGTLADPAGLDIPALLQLRDRYGEIDRNRVPAHVRQSPRGDILTVDADIFIPAAVSYAITPDAAMTLGARVVVEAANVATTEEAEAMLAARDIAVIPDFVANAGAAAWAWWLLLGRVNADPQSSFTLLRHEMRARIAPLISGWDSTRVPPRQQALHLATRRPEPDDGRLSLTIP